MYVKRIVLSGIKGFPSLDFDLTRPDGSYAGWTVFTGDNGSGKSTLLKSIAIALVGPDHARALQPSFDHWITEGARAKDQGVIELQVVPEEGVDTFTGPGNRSQHISNRVVIVNGPRGAGIEPPTSNKRSQAQRGPWATATSGWFSCGYGPFRRVLGSSSEAARLMVAPVTERFATMFQEAAALTEVTQWMQLLKLKESEGKPDEAAILQLLKDLLSDDLLPAGFVLDRIDSDGLWLRDAHDVEMSWREMSDGYRAVLALLVDIVRHLFKNHGMPKSGDPRALLNSTGVVMVDEIDAHLHPSWQREIGPWLRRQFPRIQFLVTTHSPIVCQSADENGLFVLAVNELTDQPRIVSRDEYLKIVMSKPDAILRSAAFGLQNTRSEAAVEKRSRFSKLQAKRQAGAMLSTAEQAEVDQLLLVFESDD